MTMIFLENCFSKISQKMATHSKRSTWMSVFLNDLKK